MQIEVGKTYKTRDGGTATVVDFFKYEGHFPYSGTVDCGDDGSEIEMWTKEGRAAFTIDRPTDLIEEIKPPAPQAHKTTNHE